ncbi:Retrovirus-related Pol polyprotein from transposon TNT 1-94 [Gossypium australe]|uniref:Retrovirus-related Pol polyprotein from transposon TNT 1-94 n=1 Tax=Gossypium australe TaxID=47621 RepID=A0A5B6WJD0_9ROSI|nr:Retrovirus-related Pol polyprotein from transposon TNT 1-94 [Gossypium australe]
MEQEKSTQIFVDNQAAISITNNPEGEVWLVYCSTKNQYADIFIKALRKAKFDLLRQKLEVCSSTSRMSVNFYDF